LKSLNWGKAAQAQELHLNITAVEAFDLTAIHHEQPDSACLSSSLRSVTKIALIHRRMIESALHVLASNAV
jgi:hypothetical protein